MSKSKKTGAVLDLYIMSRCADLLMQVEPARRQAIVGWLAAFVVNQQKETPPAASDPRQETIPFETSPSDVFTT